MIVKVLFRPLDARVMARGIGEVFFAPLPIRLWPGKMREPDLLYLSTDRLPLEGEPPNGADLAIEVVSEGKRNRERDLETKRREYAQAKIAEYWIVDPEEKRITVLGLDGSEYRVHGVFSPGTQAASVVLPGFTVDVAAVFA
jgi:Uma2 family endonuclease